MRTTNHHRTNGQIKVVKRCLEVNLHYLIGTKPRQWPLHLAQAEFWFNTSY